MRAVKNIIFDSKNINRHLTGTLKIITLCFGIIILSSHYVSALTYRDGVNVQFTFEPALSISLSSANLTIGNLVPGNYDSSNTITVSVDTNSVVGYTLTAKVGGTGQTAANSNLVNTLANTTFTSIANDATTTLANFADNKWGYTTAGTIESSTTFSGLLYDEDTIINATTNVGGTAATGYTGTNTTSFTIGARAAADQAAGEYTNVITFTAVANTPPPTNLQDLTLSNCPTSATTVYDGRDNKPYTIKKLADGNCWMLDNLDLDLTDLAVQTKLTSASTNATDTALNYLKGITTRDPSVDPNGNYATAGVTKNWTSGSSYSAPLIAVDSATSGPCEDDEDSDSEFCVNSNLSWSHNDTLPATINGVTSIAQGKIGIYYNYCAASAGSYCYSNDIDSGTPSGNATNDICPKGWHIPTGDYDGGEYRDLYLAYSSNYADFMTALNTPYSGFFFDDENYAYHQGYAGYFWSSSYYDGARMKSLRVKTESVDPVNNHERDHGFPIRCILDH